MSLTVLTEADPVFGASKTTANTSLTPQAVAVELASIDRPQLERALEEDAVLEVVAGPRRLGARFTAATLMAQDGVGVRPLIGPSRIAVGQARDRRDGLARPRTPGWHRARCGA